MTGQLRILAEHAASLTLMQNWLIFILIPEEYLSDLPHIIWVHALSNQIHYTYQSSTSLKKQTFHESETCIMANETFQVQWSPMRRVLYKHNETHLPKRMVTYIRLYQWAPNVLYGARPAAAWRTVSQARYSLMETQVLPYCLSREREIR